MAPPGRPPNLVLVVTDQERAPQHWPADPGWRDALMPNDAELRRTGMTFTNAFIATAMCSPSRASLLTGTYPSRHGVTLTLTAGDLFPDRRHAPDVLRTAARLALSGEAPPGRVARAFARGLLRLGPKSGDEPELPPGAPPWRRACASRATTSRSRASGTSPSRPAGGWSAADSARIERDYGFADWEPSEAGGDAKATSLRRRARRAERARLGRGLHAPDGGLAGARRPPRAVLPGLVPVNPHDVLGYPASYEEGGYARRDLDDVRVPLPRTLDEDLRDKPTVQAMTKLGLTSYLGALRRREEQQRLRRLLRAPAPRGRRQGRAAAGRARRPGRPRLAAVADRGRADRRPRRARALARRPAPEDLQRLRGVDPRAAGRVEPGAVPGAARERRARLARRRRADAAGPRRGAGRARGASTATTSDRCCGASATASATRSCSPTTTTRPATAFQEAPGQPNRIRCVRDRRWKYAVYLDPPAGGARVRALRPRGRPRRGPEPRRQAHRASAGRRRRAREARRLHGVLERLCAASGTTSPRLPPAPDGEAWGA